MSHKIITRTIMDIADVVPKIKPSMGSVWCTYMYIHISVHMLCYSQKYLLVFKYNVWNLQTFN